jgi:hypothetical protein
MQRDCDKTKYRIVKCEQYAKLRMGGYTLTLDIINQVLASKCLWKMETMHHMYESICKHTFF